MRKITKEAVERFINGGTNFKRGNTRVDCSNITNHMYLHDNLIAVNDHIHGNISVSLAGWNTNTTRERLNGIPGVNINTRNGIIYLNGSIIDDNTFHPI
jgi:hypothetical protein